MELQYSYPQVVFLAGGSINIGEPILVHDPIGFDTFGSFSGVKYKRFFNSDGLGSADGLIGAGGLPVAGSGRPIWP